MKVDSNKLINGIVNYADNEVISSLPTVGKWLLGTGIGITTTKVDDIVKSLNNNAIAKTLGIVDDNGLFDLDLIVENMKNSANRYGKMTIQVPLVGALTFSEADIDSLRNYIERG